MIPVSKQFIILTMAALLFLRCDVDRLWGYRFEAVDLTQTITIQGTVIDRFRDAPIKGATVRFADQETFSNSKGEYHLEFYLSTGFQRNKPVFIEVTADNYIPFRDTIILDPVDQQIDFTLEYGAPIVEKAVRHIFENGIAVVQAIIRDYQEDVTNVYLELEYLNDTGSRISIRYPMQWISRAEPTRNYYQGEAPIQVPRNGVQFTLGPTFRIQAEDARGFSVNQEFTQFLDENPPLFLPYTPGN